MTEHQRAIIYRAGLAVVALAAAYGLLKGEAEIAGWTGLITAIVGNGLASANTTTK